MAKNRAAFSNRDRAIWFVVFLIGLAFVLGSRNPAHAACGGSPVIVTDKPDYAPTETVAISGTGFNCRRSVLRSGHRAGRQHQVGRRHRRSRP